MNSGRKRSNTDWIASTEANSYKLSSQNQAKPSIRQTAALEAPLGCNRLDICHSCWLIWPPPSLSAISLRCAFRPIGCWRFEPPKWQVKQEPPLVEENSEAEGSNSFGPIRHVVANPRTRDDIHSSGSKEDNSSLERIDVEASISDIRSPRKARSSENTTEISEKTHTNELKCRLERDLYLDFQVFKRHTCAKCYE